MGLTSAFASNRRYIDFGTGRIITEVFPIFDSEIAFLAKAVAPCLLILSFFVKGGFTQLDCPHGISVPSILSSLGYGHGSKSKWNSLSSFL